MNDEALESLCKTEWAVQRTGWRTALSNDLLNKISLRLACLLRPRPGRVGAQRGRAAAGLPLCRPLAEGEDKPARSARSVAVLLNGIAQGVELPVPLLELALVQLPQAGAAQLLCLQHPILALLVDLLHGLPWDHLAFAVFPREVAVASGVDSARVGLVILPSHLFLEVASDIGGQSVEASFYVALDRVDHASVDVQITPRAIVAVVVVLRHLEKVLLSQTWTTHNNS
mmetsp:Transcript_12725/g.23132  ORF Transcript_12725/g.23132 Transcript_12725/m.23132 type:complete len:228 (-) Transcript_12725:82-765(-)